MPWTARSVITHSGRFSLWIATRSPDSHAEREQAHPDVRGARRRTPASVYSRQRDELVVAQRDARRPMLRRPVGGAGPAGSCRAERSTAAGRDARAVIVSAPTYASMTSLVGLDLRWAPGGHDLAEGQHEEPVDEVHDEVHLVLDEDHRHVELLADLGDVARHVLGLLEVHAGDRLVEEQELRVHGQGAAQLDALLDAVGQQPDRVVPVRPQVEQVHDLRAPAAVLDLLSPRPTPPQRTGDGPGLHEVVTAEHEVVDHRRGWRRGRGSGTSGPTPASAVAAGRMVDQVVAIEQRVAGLRPVHAVQAVEDAGLAGAVGADHAEQLAAVDRRSSRRVRAPTPPNRG